MNKPVIGLIGAIGSGKSHVAAEFVRHGAALISGDQLGHEALRQPFIRDQVIQYFGAEIAQIDGEIDRRKLGAIVFADADKLRALEKMVFPFIQRGMHDQVAAAQCDRAICLIVVDAAIMVETGWDKFCDKIVYVHAPREQRMARLAQQRGWTQQEVVARSQAQLPLTDKVTRADAAIDNSGPSEDLGPQVARLLKLWSFPVALGTGFVDNT